MTNPFKSQSQKRQQEFLGTLFGKEAGEKSLLVLKSSSDVGVMRNGGRNGARFAPKSFLSFFRKLTLSENTVNYSVSEAEVADQQDEENDFDQAQGRQAERIRTHLQKNSNARVLHLGGGHDHIYPLLTALNHFPKIVVINIDAHADTRTDEVGHSGTPFRQFARDYQGEFHLFQAGLHSFANSLSTLTPLPKGQQEILWRKELHSESKVKAFFKHISKVIDSKTVVVFSLDADAMAGSLVPGVSAVNGEGLSVQELELLWNQTLNLKLNSHPMVGIYELNPVYDNLSGLSMRVMANFFYSTL